MGGSRFEILINQLCPDTLLVFRAREHWDFEKKKTMKNLFSRRTSELIFLIIFRAREHWYFETKNKKTVWFLEGLVSQKSSFLDLLISFFGLCTLSEKTKNKMFSFYERLVDHTTFRNRFIILYTSPLGLESRVYDLNVMLLTQMFSLMIH